MSIVAALEKQIEVMKATKQSPSFAQTPLQMAVNEIKRLRARLEQIIERQGENSLAGIIAREALSE